MARAPRIHFPGAVYHVMVRGNAQAPIFFKKADRQQFHLLLEEGVERFGCRIHAFCLMSNHVHLAIQVGKAPLAGFMQTLAGRYTQWVNRRYQRVGHLFQGRYKAILVDRDSYLLALVRYIHLNPVQARLVNDPAAYPWSGHRAYLGQAALGWLTTDWVLAQFADRRAEARRRYRAFVAAGIGQAPSEGFALDAQDGRILGDDRFIERVRRHQGKAPAKAVALTTVIKAVGRAYGLEASALWAPGRQRHPAEARAMVAWLVRELPGLSLTEAAQRLGRDISSLSAAATRLARRARQDKGLARRHARLRQGL
jgi:REP element-mobilizing transposase RayT